MDIYYMSDSIQYGSFRNPLYRDYEKFPYGTLENPLNSPPKSSGQPMQKQQQQRDGYNVNQGKSKSKSSKDSCPFCKDQKKRPLGAYLRKRGQRITSESISEDVEECLEAEQEEPTTPAAGSPTNNELSGHDHHHQHERNHQVLAGGRYSRQESNESDVK